MRILGYRELSENSDVPDIIKESTRKANRMSLYLSILPIMFLALGGDKLLVLFLGAKWMAAGRMALCLAIYSVPVIISEPLLPIFRVLDKQEVRFQFNILNLVVSVGALVVSSVLFDNIYISLFFYSLFYAIIRFSIYRKILNIARLSFVEIDKKTVVLILLCYLTLLCRFLIEIV